MFDCMQMHVKFVSMAAPRMSIMVDVVDFERFTSDRKSLSDLKQSAMFRAYMRAWHMLTPQQQHDALRGIQSESPNVAGELDGTINDACNATQQAALDLRKTVDELFADGRLTKQERAAIRRKAKAVEEAACGVAVHANEPALSSA